MLYRHHNSVSGYNPTDSINHAKPHINTTPHCTGLTPLTPVARHTEADSHSLTAASTGPRPASRLGMGSARISTHLLTHAPKLGKLAVELKAAWLKR
jgi:hypothetical protein